MDEDGGRVSQDALQRERADAVERLHGGRGVQSGADGQAGLESAGESCALLRARWGSGVSRRGAESEKRCKRTEPRENNSASGDARVPESLQKTPTNPHPSKATTFSKAC